MIAQTRCFLATVAIVLWFPSGVWAGMTDGDAALKAGRFQSAIAAYTPMAMNGYPSAEERLARVYEITAITSGEFHHGTRGTNLSQAIGWYNKAADHGVWTAQRRLAQLYRIGIGVPQDALRADQLDLEATRGLSKDAARGMALAENDLADAYRKGIGVERNDNLAVLWLHKAAAQGDPLALDSLALRYIRGDGLPRNPVVAYALVLLAVRGEPFFDKNRAAIADKLSLDQIEKGKALADQWKPGLLPGQYPGQRP